MGIDIDVFKFLDLIETFKDERSQPELKIYKGDNTTPILTLDNIKDFRLNEYDPYDDGFAMTSKFVDVDGKMVGLGKENFSVFREKILTLLDDGYINKHLTPTDLVLFSFDWLMDIYKSKKAPVELRNWLYNAISDGIKNYRFYFQTLNLAIEEPITIGDILITHFSEDDLLRMYAEFGDDKHTYDQFCGLINKDSIHATIEVTNTNGMSEVIAKKRVEVAIDILKCFCLKYSLDRRFRLFDVDYRTSRPNGSHYFTFHSNSMRNLYILMRNSHRVELVKLDQDFINSANEKGMSIFGNFVRTKKDTPLYNITIDFIQQFAEIYTVENNYQKVIKSISVLENIVVPKDNGRAFGIKRVKQVISKIFNDKDTSLKLSQSINYHYEVRDKFLHNNIKYPINRDDFWLILELIRILILKVIGLNGKFDTIEKVHNYWGIK